MSIKDWRDRWKANKDTRGQIDLLRKAQKAAEPDLFIADTARVEFLLRLKLNDFETEEAVPPESIDKALLCAASVAGFDETNNTQCAPHTTDRYINYLRAELEKFSSDEYTKDNICFAAEEAYVNFKCDMEERHMQLIDAAKNNPRQR